MTWKNKYTPAILALVLAVMVIAVYWQSVEFGFIALDDLEYTVKNPFVNQGVTIEAVKRVLSSIRLLTYMPATLFSFMLEVEIFGLKPSVFHATNTILHLLNTLLLFIFLSRATGSRWKSFFVAALWALHPLRAESVAWVAERKDLLAGLFFLAGLIAYSEYARKHKPALYAAVLLFMLLSMASKITGAFFPFLFLVLDFWPLERFKQPGATVKKLLLEKAPFFALSFLFSAAMIYYNKSTVSTLEQWTIPALLADVATSYLHYIRATFWPFGLFMENRDTAARLAGVLAVCAGILLTALTVSAFRLRKATPAVLAGWLWYLAMLFPVSGIVPLDFYFVADHFSYLPHIGLIVALVWGFESIYTVFAKDKWPLAVSGGIIVLALSLLCYRQVSLWRNDYVLFGYVERMTDGQSPLAKNCLAVANFNAGNYMEAYDYFSQVLALKPDFSRANGLKGQTAVKLGKNEEAIMLFRKQLLITPGDREVSIALANTLIRAGDQPGAARQALENIRNWPKNEEARQTINYLGGEIKAREIAGML